MVAPTQRNAHQGFGGKGGACCQTINWSVVTAKAAKRKQNTKVRFLLIEEFKRGGDTPLDLAW